ncbi:hypothetical protein B7486_13715 [cyanobacterium TDX16]|nr:hypothetical protein B7486_13715 [cyanobacterium TDX16]
MREGLPKKILLMGATFLMAVAAYVVFSSPDQATVDQGAGNSADVVHKFVTRAAATTQVAVQGMTDARIPLSPGDQTRVKIYDDVSGRLKYIFEAEKWEPITETDFHLHKLAIQIYMPRGEITYINADEAEVTITRRTSTRVDPKRGRLWGNVKVVIDRTTTKWREENPELAERFAHPDDLISIFLPEARFDMDRAELFADGDVLVDSTEARIEDCRGLTVQWDQVDNRIDMLRFEQGGRMILRRGGKMIDFGMPGTTRDAKRSKSATASAAKGRGQMVAPRAEAMKPMSIAAITAAEAAAEIRLEGGAVAANQPRSLPSAAAAVHTPVGELKNADDLSAAVQQMTTEARSAVDGTPLAQSESVKERSRVHTYRAVFANNVVVEQRDGLRTIGKIEADSLEVNFDFGRKQRQQASTGPRPQGAAKVESEDDDSSGAASETSSGRTTAGLPADFSQEDQTRLTLTWNGPLEMRPIRVNAEEQTGQRFDAVAIGNPVRLMSDQVAPGGEAGAPKKATATCDQLVYRHERRQVWMSATDARPVRINVGGSGALCGREVFFDEKRGLGRVEGPGHMEDDRLDGLVADPASSDHRDKSNSARDAVRIDWARGVDLEIGRRLVRQMNPDTGTMEDKEKEYLRRAWFHGVVSVHQEGNRLLGEEVAVTFGEPHSGDDIADHIQHLNMSGNVRLERGNDVLAGERLDVEMMMSPDGRSLPKVVDGYGDVLARQENREIRANRMHVELVALPGRPRIDKNGNAQPPKFESGIDKMDAEGNVLIFDPEQNLKISRAESLKATMNAGGQLATALILGASADRPARARFGDVALHGERIDIDMTRQSMVVPGPGSSYIRTKEDFSGRKLSETTTVKTTWKDRMEFQLERNYGVFLGDIVSQTPNFRLTSDKMTVRFSNAPPPPPRKARGEVSPFRLMADVREEAGYVGAVCSTPVVAAFTATRLLCGLPQERILAKFSEMSGDRGRDDQVSLAAVGGQRKRPVYVVAEGRAEALSTEYAPDTRLGLRGRLMSRLRIAAPQIAVDLAAEQMNIPSAGTLLIEDYQFDPRERKKQSQASAEAAPMMSSLRSDGPSQTAITWQNSMDFFVDRSLVVFDKNVSMVHRSGREMVMQGELASAMGLDDASLQHIGKGRIATLRCGNLLLEFKTAKKEPKKGKSQAGARATDLARLIAKESVHLKEDTKSLTGEHLQYLADAGETRLEGANNYEATIMDEEEGSGRFMMWRGPVLIWDRPKNRIEAPKATIRTSRR